MRLDSSFEGHSLKFQGQIKASFRLIWLFFFKFDIAVYKSDKFYCSHSNLYQLPSKFLEYKLFYGCIECMIMILIMMLQVVG